jgi:hypothetical protein
MSWRWGKAGQRLDEREIATRSREAAQRRGKAQLARDADNAIAYKLWRAGELRPYRITMALNARGLYGPDVDVECGASEPDVDLWEAGKLYPTWEQVLLLAKLTGVTPRLLCTRGPDLRISDTSLRFHGFRDDPEPPVTSYPPEVVAATMAEAPGTVVPES